MAADDLAPAILAYIDHGVYPESESIASAEISQQDLNRLLIELRKTQEQVKDEIRKTSRDTAPDIDTWIQRAKQLQSDIQKSRETARAIVAEAEVGKGLRAKAEEAGKKAELLVKEVQFNGSLASTLETIGHTRDLLGHIQSDLIGGDLEQALNKAHQVDQSLQSLSLAANARVFDVLSKRLEELKENIKETTTQYWNHLVRASLELNSLTIWTSNIYELGTGEKGIEVRLAATIQAAQDVGLLPALLQKLSRDIELVILKPRLNIDVDSKVGKLLTEENRLLCTIKSDVADDTSMFQDVKLVLDFLNTQLPTTVGVSLSEILLPHLISRLEDIWFEPAIPLEAADLPAFQELLKGIEDLAAHIESLGWHGSHRLREWVAGAPKTWLTRRREVVLGETRNLVFTRFKDTKVVERVETQTIGKDDALARPPSKASAVGDDEWDADWEEAEKTSSGHNRDSDAMDADDEDASAWEIEDTEEDHKSEDKGDEEEENAWGWGDDEGGEASRIPDTSAAANGKTKPSTTTQEREVTLRETFTVTHVPDSVVSILETIVRDAQTLSAPEYQNSSIAPASSALYTLPTLALAIYRATASTAYAKSPIGNMLLYNDATYLASRLRDWQTSQAPSSRLRLDNDVNALEKFAKRIYSTEMEAQRTILRDLLDGAQGFSNSTVTPYKQECESAVEQAVDRLREIHRQWDGVLSRGALLQTLGSLLASVTGKMITEIEELGDIGEADSHQLTALIQKVSTIKELFLQTQAGGESAGTDMTFIYCPNWLKFQYLAEIMESSLADIRFLWNEGELSLEYDAEEVIELIEALFAESDIRKKTIAEIRRSRR